jgi:circadian clock protein KaiC
MGSVKKAVSVIKKRGGQHETTIREYRVTSQGLEVGEPLREFQGVLTGVPVYVGDDDKIMTRDARSHANLS